MGVLIGLGLAAFILVVWVFNFGIWGGLAGDFAEKTSARLQERLKARGLALREGWTLSRFSASGEISGVPVALDVLEIAPQKTGTAIRARLRTPRPEALLCAATALRLDEISGLSEVAIAPELDRTMRAFARDAAAVQGWLRPWLGRLLLELGPSLREVRSRNGEIVLSLNGVVSDPDALDRALHAVVAMAGDDPQLAAPFRPEPSPKLDDASSLPGVLLLVSTLGLLPLGFFVPFSSNLVLSLAEPVVCDEGEDLKTVQQGRGGGFACVNRKTRERRYQNMLTWLVFASGSLLAIQVVGWPLIRIERMRRRRGA
jgi:hypothetical protein